MCVCVFVHTNTNKYIHTYVCICINSIYTYIHTYREGEGVRENCFIKGKYYIYRERERERAREREKVCVRERPASSKENSIMTFAPSHRHTVWTCTSHTVTYAHRLNLDKRSPSPLRTTSEPPQNKLQQKNKRSNFHPAIDQLNDEVGHVRETKKIKKIQKKNVACCSLALARMLGASSKLVT